MIARNTQTVDLNEKNKLTDKIKEQFDYLKKTFRFPMVIVYPQEFVKHDPDNPNKPNQPNSHAIPLTSTIHTSDGSTAWTYYENVTHLPNNTRQFGPSKLVFNGRKTIDENNIELAWYLYFMSPHGKNTGFEGKRKRLYFEFENLEKAADAFMDDVAKELKVKKLIFETYSEKKLKEVCKSWMLPINDYDSINIVRKKLMDKISLLNRTGKKGYSEFLEKTGEAKDEVYVLIKKLQESGRLELIIEGKNRIKWVLKDEEGKIMEELYNQFGSSEKSVGILADHLKKKPETIERLKLI